MASSAGRGRSSRSAARIRTPLHCDEVARATWCEYRPLRPRTGSGRPRYRTYGWQPTTTGTAKGRNQKIRGAAHRGRYLYSIPDVQREQRRVAGRGRVRRARPLRSEPKSRASTQTGAAQSDSIRALMIVPGRAVRIFGGSADARSGVAFAAVPSSGSSCWTRCSRRVCSSTAGRPSPRHSASLAAARWHGARRSCWRTVTDRRSSRILAVPEHPRAGSAPSTPRSRYLPLAHVPSAQERGWRVRCAQPWPRPVACRADLRVLAGL